MSFDIIENDIEAGKVDRPAPILLCGEEHFLVEHYETRLKDLFGADKLNISVFHGDEAGDEAIMAALDTFPLFSPVRVVIVKNHSGFSGNSGGSVRENTSKNTNALSDYIAKIPETSRLIFTAGSTNKTRALYKAAAKHGTVYTFAQLEKPALRNFILKRFASMNVRISNEVLEDFIFATGYLEKDSDRDLFSVSNDVFKVASFALSEGRKAILAADAEECMPGVLRTDIFAMLDAISSGEKAVAIRLLENAISGGESVFRLLSLFTGHFEIILGCKELGAQGHTPADITKLLGERSEWRVKKLSGFAHRFELPKLMHILSRLYETERDIKSGNIAERHALTVLLAGI